MKQLSKWRQSGPLSKFVRGSIAEVDSVALGSRMGDSSEAASLAYSKRARIAADQDMGPFRKDKSWDLVVSGLPSLACLSGVLDQV